MSEPFLGQIIQAGFNFAPRGWALCWGQTMSIAQNTALFSLLGTTFGGNGQTTFSLPDLRGRTMVGQGQGPGLQDYSMGEIQGVENTTLTILNMPIHNHTATFNGASSTMNVSTAHSESQVAAAGSVLGKALDGATGGTAHPYIYAPSGTQTTIPLAGLNVAGTVTVNTNGGSQPFSILNPQLTINQCIALQGIFPSRN